MIGAFSPLVPSRSSLTAAFAGARALSSGQGVGVRVATLARQAAPATPQRFRPGLSGGGGGGSTASAPASAPAPFSASTGFVPFVDPNAGAPDPNAVVQASSSTPQGSGDGTSAPMQPVASTSPGAPSSGTTTAKTNPVIYVVGGLALVVVAAFALTRGKR